LFFKFGEKRFFQNFPKGFFSKNFFKSQKTFFKKLFQIFQKTFRVKSATVSEKEIFFFCFFLSF